MAYTEKARALRRCRHHCRDGRPCRCWAVWADPLGRCRSHGGRHPSGVPSERTRPVHCTCVAYAWPHRPGGGVCRWPDSPMLRLPRPAGTHSDMRLRGPLLAFACLCHPLWGLYARGRRETW